MLEDMVVVGATYQRQIEPKRGYHYDIRNTCGSSAVNYSVSFNSNAEMPNVWDSFMNIGYYYGSIAKAMPCGIVLSRFHSSQLLKMSKSERFEPNCYQDNPDCNAPWGRNVRGNRNALETTIFCLLQCHPGPQCPA